MGTPWKVLVQPFFVAHLVAFTTDHLIPVVWVKSKDQTETWANGEMRPLVHREEEIRGGKRTQLGGLS